MDYQELYIHLKDSFRTDQASKALGDGLWVSHLDFHSANGLILPGECRYACATHPDRSWGADPHAEGPPASAGLLDVQDSHVSGNRAFRYPVFHRKATERAQECLLLFHGFNEKDWQKYLPWAHRLAQLTGKAVLLFPLAFHMNRALGEWSDPRLMHRFSEARRKAYPGMIGSSLSNVAISTRLLARPQRFIWSGLQTYHDVVQLMGEIRSDRHPLVAPTASVDILAYSIGGLLAQVLMMANPKGFFDHSRLCLFCSGAVFNRMSPVTKFILDSEANVALYSYLVEHLESHMREDGRLGHYLGPDHPEGMLYRSMLNYGVMRQEREAHFRRLAPRLMAIALEQDTVVPPYEVMNALRGSRRDLPVPVTVLDFPYPYQHEDPFPARESLRGEVDEAFRQVIDRAAAFYGQACD